MAAIEYEKFEVLDEEDGLTKTVEVQIKKFPQTAEKGLKNYFGEFSASADLTKFGGDLAVGSIEDYFLSQVIEKVTIDDKQIRISNRGVWASLPEYMYTTDEDPEEGLGERLVRLGVKHNVRIAQHRKFSMVFGEYLPPGVELKDPMGAGSTNGSSNRSLPEATSTSSQKENS